MTTKLQVGYLELGHTASDSCAALQAGLVASQVVV